jgi:hypothetical protein
VTWSIEGEPEGFFRVAAPVLRGMVKRQVESQLGNLKDLLEAGAD